jgi:hypothetical protein
MADRDTILKQIDQVQAQSIATINALTIIRKGVMEEPMQFYMHGIDSLRVLEMAVANLALTMQHTLDQQRLEAQFKARQIAQAEKFQSKRKNL